MDYSVSYCYSHGLYFGRDILIMFSVSADNLGHSWCGKVPNLDPELLPERSWRNLDVQRR